MRQNNVLAYFSLNEWQEGWEEWRNGMDKKGLLGKKYLVSAEEMKEYDRNTIEYFGMPSMVLMERAALAAAEEIKARFSAGKRVLVVAGCGNNGGDGIAVGRMLGQDGFCVDFCLVGDREKCSKETEIQLKIVEKYGYFLQSKIEDKEYDIIVDALFGVGLSRKLEGEFAEAVRRMNRSGAFVCSIDMPSGIHTDSGEIMGEAVRADLTVTFAFEKLGQKLYPGRRYVGEIVCREIGITPESFSGQGPKVYTLAGEAALAMPERDGGGNKGTFGKALVIAGSINMSGACELCAKSVCRMGAGMVKIMTPEENRVIVQTGIPEALLAVYRVKKEKKGEISEKLHKILEREMEWADCIVIGPGIGKGREARALLEQVLADGTKPLVIDADGLNLLAESPEMQELLTERGRKEKNIVLTPHLAEFSRLYGCTVKEAKSGILCKPKELAEKYGCVIVCKDAATAVAVPEEDVIYLNTVGNDGMATAGMGDVLAGVIGGLLAQGMAAGKAAVLGVYIHGLAGDMAAKEKGRYALMAGDVIECLGSITKEG